MNAITFRNEYGETAWTLVQDISTARFYAPTDPAARATLPPHIMPMPPGHCMFVDPYGYGAVPVRDGRGFIPAKDLPRVREIIVSAMRAYWHVARREHSWREIYPEKSDARALAISLARFMSDRKMRFPRKGA